jgi:hypothetical protein
MAISEQDLSAIGDARVRRLLTDVLSREYTALSQLAGQLYDVAFDVEEVDLDQLRRASPETVRDELRRCESGLRRLTMCFEELADNVDELLDA